MPRFLLMALLCVVAGACDPGYFVKSEGMVTLHPDESMVLDAMRADELVEAVRTTDGLHHARLAVPPGPDRPNESSTISIRIKRSGNFEINLEFEVLWLGRGPSAEERERWKGILDGLRDRVLARFNEQVTALGSSDAD